MKRIGYGLLVFLISGMFAAWPPPASAQPRPVDVVFLSQPFGTHFYSIAAAAEQVFKKANSWVRVRHQETPGAMYMFRYLSENLEKMKKGEVAHSFITGAPEVIAYIVEGRPPFDNLPWTTAKAIVSTPAGMGVYVTFDPNIKSLDQLEGKRVCTAERSRPFQSILLDRPLFGSLGIYDAIRWSFLGDSGCKDALLNNNVDALPLRFMGSVDFNEEGMMVTTRVSGGPATLEILNSGRRLFFIPLPPEVLAKASALPGALRQPPIIFKKGAFEGLDQDIYGRAGPMCIMGDASVPDEIIMEMVRVWHEYRSEFGKYADFLNFMPQTPYPIGASADEVHPGVLRAMETMGLPIPTFGSKGDAVD